MCGESFPGWGGNMAIGGNTESFQVVNLRGVVSCQDGGGAAVGGVRGELPGGMPLPPGHQLLPSSSVSTRTAAGASTARPTGVYREGCGLASVHMSWSASEYLYMVRLHATT